MVESTRPPRNSFNAKMRKIYNPLGFAKAYNFVLWFIFSGALLGFCLARAPYMNVDQFFCGPKRPSLAAGPGECYYYLMHNHYRAGIFIHLIGIISAGFLVLFQFIPAIRHNVIIFHRINGYVVIILVFVSNAGALMVARRAFGGTFTSQIYIGALVILSTIFLGLAYYNIKRLQIDQHRAWMLRAWFYMGAIITQRFIFAASFKIITSIGDYYFAVECGKIEYILGKTKTAKMYPTCSQPPHYAVVHANFNGSAEQIASLMDQIFGPALWLALLLHAFGVELYVS